MTITRDQFIRGFNALKASDARRDAVNTALSAGYDFHCHVGTDPAYHELVRQLEERCRDREDENGPWPEDCLGEGDISIGLDTGLGGYYDDKGNEVPHLTTAEDIWDRWEREQAGPFRPRRGAGDRDHAAALIRPILDDFADEVAQASLGKVSARQARRLHAKNAAVNRLLESIR